MARTNNYKSEEARLREKKHQFGQKDGNPQGNPHTAASQRKFYRWCECEATEQELKEYVEDKSNPASRRKFVTALMKCNKVQDFFDLTNQTHGMPKQVVENTDVAKIEIILE